MLKCLDICLNFKTNKMKKRLTLFAALATTFVFAQQTQEKDSIATTTLSEVVVMGGVIDLAEDRQTPIAVSRVEAADIERLGGQFDLISTIKTTPSIHVRNGTGFGDEYMYLRGFDQTNTAFLINGQPVNSAEDGRVFWSNWSGLMEIAETIEVQRGLGSSKLAISSVGGTVNIVTKTVDQKAGGFVKSTLGTNNYFKNSAYVSTGLQDNGWAFAALFGHWQGDGMTYTSKGQGQVYYFSIGYKPNENNIFNMFITGAPQWHGAGGGDTIQQYLDHGNTYAEWGGYRNGDLYPGGRNFYHKPLYNLSWDWRINDTSDLSTVVYGTNGRGGFALPRGDVEYGTGTPGWIDFDATIADNIANESNSGNQGIIAGSINGHNQYGIVSNFTKEVNENLTINVGFDLRTYNGVHWYSIVDKLGLNTYNRDGGASQTYGYNPWDALDMPGNGERDDYAIRYDYEEVINLGSVFGQAEYANDKFSAFFQGSVSSQSHEKEDFFNINEKAEKITNNGFNIKLGGSLNISDKAKVYANTGFYSRQPFHDDLYDNIRYSNALNTAAEDNQEITGIELGYQYETENFRLIIDLYSTKWDNRFLTSTTFDSNNIIVSYDKSDAISSLHKGIEVQWAYKPTNDISLDGYVSLGDWKYTSDVITRTFDDNDQLISSGDMNYIDGVKTGNAPQTTIGGNFKYAITEDVNFALTLNHTANMYGEVNFGDAIFDTAGNADKLLMLPAYTLVDAFISFKVPFADDKLDASLGVFNMFDTFYFEFLDGNTQATSSDNTWYGINTSNRVDPGYGRTFSLGLKYNF